jgi:hypothetical protein
MTQKAVLALKNISWCQHARVLADNGGTAAASAHAFT